MARSRPSLLGMSDPKPARRGKRLLVVSLLSALAVYLFDPQEGARRRSNLAGRVLGLLRRGGKEAAGQAQNVAGHAKGAAHEIGETVTPDRTTAEPMNDQTLIRKVETTIFRDPYVPRAGIVVDAAGGTVWLRGEARTPEMIKELERQTQAIPEVGRVENLLHLPNTPAPTRTDSPEGVRADTSFSAPGERSVAEVGVTAEEPVAEAENPPDEKAASKEGRTPAPFGSEEPGGDEESGEGSAGQ